MSLTAEAPASVAIHGHNLRPSPEEIAAGRLDPETLRIALRTFREVGVVVLEQVFDRAWLSTFRQTFDAGLNAHIAAQGGVDVMPTFGPRHIGWHPPLAGAFADPALVAPPVAVQLLDRLLGNDFHCPYFHTNTAWPGSGHQPIHRDDNPLFADELQVAHPPVSIVVNVALDDFTVENGATEVWPGSHLVPDRDASDAQEVPARAATMPSIRTLMPAGSLVLRDLRCYHRGVPNHSTAPRRMTAAVYVRAWKRGGPERIPRATWDAWPERVRHAFRFNEIVDAGALETST